jgi:hypothetical protein
VIATAVGQHEKAAAYLAKATSMQQMLLPSERKILAVTQAFNPISDSTNIETNQQLTRANR